jgi:hypothetical protein
MSAGGSHPASHTAENERCRVLVALDSRVRLEVELVEETIPIGHESQAAVISWP